MLRFPSRVGHWPLALTLAALGACADEPTAPGVSHIARPNANLGDIISVTTTSGGKEVGSLRWAVAQTTGGEIIRFAPALAGATIVIDSIAPVVYPITIEGPADKGVTISGGNAWHIFEIAPDSRRPRRSGTSRSSTARDRAAPAAVACCPPPMPCSRT